jgi:hypothetical protein
MKFLYLKKSKLNEQLYAKHLECTAAWPTCWTTIHRIIDKNLKLEMETHYDNLNKKLDSLQVEHNKHGKHKNGSRQQIFYPHTINLTNISFTKE